MKWFRDLGFIVSRVEQTIRGRGIVFHKDAFGFGDLLVAKPGWGVALVQVTDASDFSKRILKILGKPQDSNDPKSVEAAKEVRSNAETWLRSGDKIFVHAWSKKGPRGERKRWTLSEREMSLWDFVESPSNNPAA